MWQKCRMEADGVYHVSLPAGKDIIYFCPEVGCRMVLLAGRIENKIKAVLYRRLY